MVELADTLDLGDATSVEENKICGYGGIGRRGSFRCCYLCVQVQILLPAVRDRTGRFLYSLLAVVAFLQFKFWLTKQGIHLVPVYAFLFYSNIFSFTLPFSS